MTSSTHIDTAQYAAGGLRPDERVRAETHLSQCTHCQREFAQYADALLALSEDLATAPPPQARARILQATHAEDSPVPSAGSQACEDVTANDELRTRRAGRRRVLLSLAAAAAVLIVAFAVWRPWAAEERGVASTEAVMTAQDAQEFSIELSAEATISVIRSPEMGKAVLVIDGMSPPAGYDYQAWFMIDGSAASAGVMPPPTVGTSEMVLEGDPMDATAITITVEPKGGSDAMSDEQIATINF